MPLVAPSPMPSSGAPRTTLEQRIASGKPTREAIWRDLRAMRYQPPGYAQKGERKRVFCAALEQAEQLFRASSLVGYSSRPLLLFYGISQAGRAIAATSTHTKNNDWKLSGHGIQAIGINEVKQVADIELIDQGTGSFTQLANLFNSGSLPKGTDLGSVWATIPELLELPLKGKNVDPKRVLVLDPQYPQPEGRYCAWLRNLPKNLTATPNEGDLLTFLKAYPSLDNHSSPGQNYAPHHIDPSSSIVSIPRAWERTQNKNLEAFYRSLTQAYRTERDRWVFPAIGGSQSPLSPLLAWWAILYALSMLARYSPANWNSFIDVNGDASAVPLEAALDVATEVCPYLIERAILDVSS